MVYDRNLYITNTKGKITRIAFWKNNAFTFLGIQHQLIIIKPTARNSEIAVDYGLNHLRIAITKINLAIISITGLISTINKIEQIIKKRRGPNTDPWGTPLEKTTTSEVTSSILTRWDVKGCIIEWGI